jgi:hypothetical protein
MAESPDSTSTTDSTAQAPSHLFLLRLWPQGSGEGRAEWCGKVQHIMTGESHRFLGWPMMVELLSAMLAGLEEGTSSEC